MDKEKQIEEMAQAIFDYVDTKNMGSVYVCGNKAIEEAKPFLHNTGIAEFMYRRGYRKQSETAREILQMIKDKGLFRYGGYLLHDSDFDTIGKLYGVEVNNEV